MPRSLGGSGARAPGAAGPAAAACSAEMVGRYVFPALHVPGFDVRNAMSWPRPSTEVAVGGVEFRHKGSAKSALTSWLSMYEWKVLEFRVTE